MRNLIIIISYNNNLIYNNKLIIIYNNNQSIILHKNIKIVFDFIVFFIIIDLKISGKNAGPIKSS